MIFSILGDCGSGKTLLMTYLLYSDFKKGYPIYANYKLNFEFNHLTSAFFKDYAKFPVYKATLGFDEFSLYMNARRFASKQNMNLSPFIKQTRKRELSLYWSAQQNRQVDILVRENTDGLYLPDLYVKRKASGKFKLKPLEWKHKEGDKYILRYQFYNKYGVRKKTRVIRNAEKLFPMYDTFEIMDFDEVKADA
jgi:hypothetical protein